MIPDLTVSDRSTSARIALRTDQKNIEKKKTDTQTFTRSHSTKISESGKPNFSV